MKNEITSQEWFNALLEECDALITETVFKARWSFIEGYYELGKIINENRHNFERSEIYGDKIVQLIAESLGKSTRTIYYAMQFAATYDDINKLPDGKNISWNKVCKLLSKQKEFECSHAKYVEITIRKCKDCKKILNEEISAAK